MPDAAEIVQKFARPLLDATFKVLPVVINLSQTSYKFYRRLPIEYVQLLIGTVMCFFGGFYPTVLAALQAAEHGGLTTVRKALSVLSKEVMVIIEENKKDDKVDADGDGIADAKQIDGKELLARKAKLILAKINPEKVNDAIVSIYKVWISVLAVLTIQFARTIALSLTISSFIKQLADRFLLPIVRRAIPKEYQQWCPVVLDWWYKSIGISIAWKIQTIISAFTSAIAGGLIMSRALMLIRFKGAKNHEDTYRDEILSYVFGGIGFYFQYGQSFDPPGVVKLLLWPVELAEYYIRWSITDN